MKPANAVLSSYGTTIFEVMSGLAREHASINLGQGFPDNNGPEDVVAMAAQALVEGSNQYPPMMGLPSLREAIAAHDRRFYGIEADWRAQTMVTSGATEALTAALLALIEPGDEVVLVEPLYDSYLPIIRLAGGVPKLVRLEAPDWSLPADALTAAFSDRTKLILYNTPHNPTAKVFTRAELALIASLVIKHDAYAVCDEVYEHLVFQPHEHVPLITLPGMADRTLKIGSAGKTFSLTGWKVGYLTGSPELIARVGRAHQFLTFTTPPNLQTAVAYGLGKPDGYFHLISSELQAKRDRFVDGMTAIGFAMLPCQGTYFATADLGSVGWTGGDEAFCRHITTAAGVTAIPVSAFYGSDDAPTHLARFCFAKRDAVLDDALGRLRRLFG